MDNWQLVHSDGEIVDADDISSKSSEWTIMDECIVDCPEEDFYTSFDDLSSPSLSLHTNAEVPNEPTSSPPSSNRRRHRRPARRRGRAAVGCHSDASPTTRANSAVVRQTVAPVAASSDANAQLANRVGLFAEISNQRRFLRRGGEVMPKPQQDRKHTKWLYGGGRIGTPHQRMKVKVA